jgi:hypothetical protein
MMKHFQKYLYGQEFHVRINHSTPTCLSGVVNLEGQTVHWVISKNKLLHLNIAKGRSTPTEMFSSTRTQMHSLEDHVQQHALSAKK